MEIFPFLYLGIKELLMLVIKGAHHQMRDMLPKKMFQSIESCSS